MIQIHYQRLSGDVTMSVAELVLRETEPTEIPLSYSLEINPVSQSWEMGNGVDLMIYQQVVVLELQR